MEAFWTALIFVFLAEMGDKTQVVSLVFGAKYKLWTVLSAISVSVFLMLFIWVVLGEIAGRLLSIFWINLISGILFIGFGLWTLKEGEEEETQIKEQRSPFLTVAISFFLAELGDKTLVAAATIASRQHAFFQVWIGGSLGMILADFLAVLVGRIFHKRLPEKALRYGTAAVFVGCGLYMLWETLSGPMHLPSHL